MKKYRVKYEDSINAISEGFNPLDAIIRALSKLYIDWESAPLNKIQAIQLSE